MKFQKLTEGVRAIQIATEEVHAHMDNVMRDNCARDSEQNNRIKQIQEGLACFIERCDPAHPTPAHSFATPCAPKMSTPITPSGVPLRYRSDFPFASPVNQAAPTEPTRDNGGHDLSQRPTYEDEHGNSGDIQHSPTNNSSGMNNSASRPSSSPKVPILDGTVSAQFRLWIIQFEAIARHQCWTMGERVVRLVASLTGPAANMLIGMTMGQLDDYAFLVERLSRIYDPPKRKEVVRLVASLTGPAANMLIGMTMGQLDDYAVLVARLSRRYDPPECEEAHRMELHAQDVEMRQLMSSQRISKIWPSVLTRTRTRAC